MGAKGEEAQPELIEPRLFSHLTVYFKPIRKAPCDCTPPRLEEILSVCHA